MKDGVPCLHCRFGAMPAEAAFVDAIRDDPDDRMLPLVYADWLDEQGDSRGELIRLQCELDGVPLANPHRQVLRIAIQDLCRLYQSDWVMPLRRRVLNWQEARVHCGLIENVSMSPTAFLKHAESGLFEEMPHLVGVTLQGAEKSLNRALASPYIGSLNSLRLKVIGPYFGELIQRLASLATVRNLTSLNLCDGHFGDEAISVLLRSNAFPRLKRLNLQHNALTFRIAESLVESPFATQLELLALGSRWEYGRNRLEDAGVRILAESRTPLRLRWLDLAGNELGDSSAWDLSNADCLENIECLYLAGNSFGQASRNALEARFPGRVFHAPCEPESVCL